MDWSTALDLSAFNAELVTVGGIAVGVGLALWAPKRIWKFFKGFGG